ncbi:hypothetical protein Glove_60g49 [Diversispora epigaea]|uniref:Glucosyltransferase 24 catalytic domain-containing protein n=1 Tax=Diversispora epigaea TaxID=1348612 RepID=A0A397JIH8_9GLOM|nr:hypothetical protein Glove_60g49 [Diversispora epigaea]
MHKLLVFGIWDLGFWQKILIIIWDLGFGILAFGISAFGFRIWAAGISIATAKTIDLCNNPLTKEPKLFIAKRKIPEWKSYYEKVANLAARIAQRKGSISVNNEIQDHDNEINDKTYDDKTNYETKDKTNDKSKEKIIVKESINAISSTSPTTHIKDEL